MKYNITTKTVKPSARRSLAALLLVAIFVLSSVVPAYAAHNPSANISEKDALSISLAHAELTEDQVTVKKNISYEKQGVWLYDIIFLSSTTKYSYEIHAGTGDVLTVYSNSISGGNNQGNSNIGGGYNTVNGNTGSNGGNTALIGQEKAKEIALAQAGLTEDQVTVKKNTSYEKQGVWLYDIIFLSSTTKYSYEIHAGTGDVLTVYTNSISGGNNQGNSNVGGGYNTVNGNTGSNGGKTAFIGQEKAKEIALAHAGLTEDQVTVKKNTSYEKQGVWLYDIIFLSSTTKYSYEIHAGTGDVLTVYTNSISGGNNQGNSNIGGGNNTGNGNAGSNGGNTAFIGLEKAKEIALSHAGLAEDQVRMKKATSYTKRAVWIYDIIFLSATTKYRYEIHAGTGSILAVYTNPVSGEQDQDDSSSGSENTDFIGLEKAREIALAHAGLSEDSVKKMKTKLDEDDQRYIYEVEFKFGNQEYKYEIDAVSSDILHFERDGKIGEEAIGAPFTDVTTHWGKNSITWSYENGLFSGITETQFGPENRMTRGMLAMVLYRLEGCPVVSQATSYTDVARGQYYHDAVVWATEAGVVSGTGNGRYSPGENISREQLATMLYRYATIAATAEVSNELSSFADHRDISAWAENALSWAVWKGIINGKGNDILDPKGQATRAEISTVLQNYCG